MLTSSFLLLNTPFPIAVTVLGIVTAEHPFKTTSVNTPELLITQTGDAVSEICVTVFVTVFGYAVPTPAVTNIRPTRLVASVLGVAVTAIVPLPDIPDVESESQLSDFVAVHDVLAATAMLDVPPAAVNPSDDLPNETETRMLPQSLLLKLDPAELTVSTQYQYFLPGTRLLVVA